MMEKQILLVQVSAVVFLLRGGPVTAQADDVTEIPEQYELSINRGEETAALAAKIRNGVALVFIYNHQSITSFKSSFMPRKQPFCSTHSSFSI